MENETNNVKENDIDNPLVLGLTLTTEVNRKYDGPDADNPNKFPGKCFRVLLLPRILDVLCFWGAAGIFLWNQANGKYKYFAVRILNPDSTTDFLHTFLELKTILITLAFAAITAVVFWMRVAYIKAKRVKSKEPYPLTRQSFPHADIHKVGLFFSTIFLALFLTVVYFVASLILKNSWKEMPLTVDLGILAGIIILVNLFACLKVNGSVARCYTCHVISSMMNQEFKVAETFYGDASVRVPEGKYQTKKRVYLNRQLMSETTTDHVYGEIRTYENVRHDRVRSSVRCPYCLQVYDDMLVEVNDDLTNKKLKGVATFSDEKTHWY